MPTLRERASALKAKAAVLVLAMKHPRTPWYAKACGLLTVLYLLAPIDLIPDFLPVIGHLDDILLVPFGIWLTYKLIPTEIWEECEAEVARQQLQKPAKDWRGVVLIVAIWMLLALVGVLLVRWLLT
ncbi:MAG: DUF1232 domain-containing protein [Planctomycetes bacterium]|nr:DUF1232 domain-containing protein [Planctomycetota bacterium]